MINSLRLQHFRSYDDASYVFVPGVNIIVGPNASGKTNLLEAILICSLGNSYRVKDADLVSFGSDWTRLDAQTETEERTVRIQLSPSGVARKSFEIEGKKYQRLSIQKTVPTVLFEPEDLQMLSGVPELRRNFLDGLIEQMVPGFATVRRHYRRTLSQRNALLKRGEGFARPQMFAWDLRLSELGGKIASERMKLIEHINELLPAIHKELSGHNEPVEVGYMTKCVSDQYESSLLSKLELNLSRDALVGFTTYGPHRDDLTITLRGHEIQDTASRGETRTLVLSLKIIELKLLHEIRGQAPLLLLDDVFSELDANRRQALTSYLSAYQTFITTTDADITRHFPVSASVIRIG